MAAFKKASSHDNDHRAQARIARDAPVIFLARQQRLGVVLEHIGFAIYDIRFTSGLENRDSA
jgi:hypothetical protein